MTTKINETHVKIGFFGMLLVVLAGIHLAIPDFYRTVWALSTSGNMQGNYSLFTVFRHLGCSCQYDH
jgi:hypothetical protein